MNVVHRVLSTPLAFKHLRFDPMELNAKDAETLQEEKAWDEFHTSDAYHQMCNTAPIDQSSGEIAKVIAIFLEHDKTPLSKNGIFCG